MRLTDDEVILLGYDVSKSSSVRCVRRSENKIKEVRIKSSRQVDVGWVEYLNAYNI